MKILIVHRYFWPDQANCGQILFNVAKHYQFQGHSVDILTSQPSRNISSKNIEIKTKINQNIHITRINLPYEVGKPFRRLLNAFKLGFFTNYFSLYKKYDVIIATSVPAILGGFFAAIAAFFSKAKFVYFCMDLYPEVGKVSGDFSNPILYKFLDKIDSWSCSQADAVVVHSLDMKKTLTKRNGGKKFKINIINNFSVPDENIINFTSNINFKFSKKKLTIIFIGNIGRFQGLENIIEAMSLIKLKGRKDIRLIIMGNGSAKKNLIDLANKRKANIFFFDHQPIKIMKKFIFKSDIGLVTLKPSIFKYAYPGKVMTYLEQGKPIISTVEKKSELVKKMISEGYGFYAPFADPNRIAKLLIDLADNPSWKIKFKKAAFKSYYKNFCREKILKKWTDLLDSVTKL